MTGYDWLMLRTGKTNGHSTSARATLRCFRMFSLYACIYWHGFGFHGDDLHGDIW